MSKLPTARPALGLLTLLAAALLGLAGAGSVGSTPDSSAAGGGRSVAVNNTGSDFTPPGPIM
ncbi:hypothetical protein [Streptomyces sp. NPDC001903]|uniref:hypothetical protein n=1 Tax=Streptomyces sp. NPDC001903 TaxID=3364622 RepID=UPI0036B86637